MSITPSMLVDTLTPQTRALTSDSMGGYTEVWSDGTAFKGRVSSLPINERMAEDKTTVFASHKIFCNVQTIDEKARIRNSTSTVYYQIKGVVKPSNLSTGHLEILVLELD